MIKIENTDVYGFEAAIRGMRNPMNSWSKSDSYSGDFIDKQHLGFVIGENDLKLMKSLSKAGNDHGKFLRMINVTCDIIAPLYWWKEFDTYKIGTVANSCSTMHKIHAKEFTIDDFSCEHLHKKSFQCLMCTIDVLNYWRDIYSHGGMVDDLNGTSCTIYKAIDKEAWCQMIQLLPSSYNQKRTIQLNYAVLKNIYISRKDHKLDEWRDLCKWIEGLPYFKKICIDDME